MTIKIFTYPANTRAFKSQIAAKYAGVEIEVPAFNFETDRQTAEFKANFPLGKVPAMLTAEGKPLYESNAMARYVARLGGDIYGSDAYTQAVNDQWIDYSSNEIDPINMGWLYSILGYTDYIAKETQKAKENTKKALAFLDSQLVAKPFLTGFRIALADIVVACSLYNFYKLLLEPSFRAPYVNVNRWFNTCINQPNFKAVVGEFTFCEKMMVYVPPKKEVKEEKPKAAPAPKKEEAAEEEEAEKPKKKNPLDDLPPSTFVLDEFKRVYSNNEVTMSVPWFFEHFDAAGFSVFHCEYKFNDELGPLFKTCNLVGGWFQRLETLHKYAFASIIIGGEEVAGSNPKDQSITGIWVFRGAEIPHDMNDCDDSLVYNWKKLDVVADKDLITKYLTWEVPKFLQGKLYK